MTIDNFQSEFICGYGFLKLKEKEDQNKTECLYHYTTLDAFTNIMQTREFWVSNIRFMNDSQEFENARNICQTIITDKLHRCSETEKDYIMVLQDICQSNISNGFRKINAKGIYSLSFCKEGDLLTQWQVYGKNGISIGFRNKLLIDKTDSIIFMNGDQYRQETECITTGISHPHDERFLFSGISVVYNDIEKEKLINGIIDIGKRKLDKFGKIIINQVREEIADEFFSVFPYMKDYHYEHEKEYRLLFEEPVNASWIHYRIRNGVIVPYIKIKILNSNCRLHEKFPIDDIVIAPSANSDYISDSVKYFLEKTGYEYLVDKVRISEISYRG